MAMAEAEYNTRHTKAILNVLLCVAMTLDLAEGADHPDASVLGRSLLPSPLVDGFINTAKMSGVVPEGDGIVPWRSRTSFISHYIVVDENYPHCLASRFTAYDSRLRPGPLKMYQSSTHSGCSQFGFADRLC